MRSSFSPITQSGVKLGFSLLELIVVLGLSGLVIGSLGLICRSFVKEMSPPTIQYSDTIYEVAPSLKATMSAFGFHRVFLSFLEKSELCLTFGGTLNNDFPSHCFLPINKDFDFASLLKLKPLIQGKFLTTKSLVESNEADIQGFFEKMASDSDLNKKGLTSILLGQNPKESAFVQLRGFQYELLDESYNLYSVVIYSIEDRQELGSYHYAIKSNEDTYAHCDSLKRFFYNDDDNTEGPRESFDIVVFPDPYALANNEKSSISSGKSLSRFTYVLDVF